MTYTQIYDPMTNAVSDKIIQRDEDSAFIPNDDRNKDWRAYQAWLAEGNEPNPPPPRAEPPIEAAPPPDIHEMNALLLDLHDRVEALEEENRRRKGRK